MSKKSGGTASDTSAASDVPANPLEQLAQQVGAQIDGGLADVKKSLSLPDSSDAQLIKARNDAITAATWGIEQAFHVGLEAGHAVGCEDAQKSIGGGDLNKDLDNVTQLAYILDSIERLANDVLLDGVQEGKPSDLAMQITSWRTDGLKLLQAIAAFEATDPRGEDDDGEGVDGDDVAKSACKDKKKKADDAEDAKDGNDDEAAEGGDETAEKAVFLGPLAKFNAILAAIDVAAEASAEGCLAKSITPTPFTKLSMATAAFAESLNALPPEVAVEFTKGVGTILEADLLGKARGDAIDPATLKTLQKHAAAILDLSRSELAKSEPKVVENIADPATRAARLAKLNK